MQISYASAFRRAFRKLVQQAPDLRERMDRTILHLAEDPAYPSQHVHPVRSWPGCWEARVNDSIRIIFARQDDEIVLLMIGRHDMLP